MVALVLKVPLEIGRSRVTATAIANQMAWFRSEVSISVSKGLRKASIPFVYAANGSSRQSIFGLPNGTGIALS